MKNIFLGLLFFTFTIISFAQVDKISVVNDNDGMKLIVNGENFIVNGMNWDYFPIGTNFSYSLSPLFVTSKKGQFSLATDDLKER